MKITDVKATGLAQTTQTVVQVYTDEGLVGVGHSDSSPYVRYIIEGELKPLVQGEDPLEVGKLWTKMYRAVSWHGFRGITLHGMAGIDMALWDLAGQKLGQPVWKLLGGRFRDRVTPYASLGFHGEADWLKREAAKYRDLGFRAEKFGWGPFGRVSVEKDEEMVKAVRESAGEEMKLIIDAGRPPDANASRMIQTARRIEKYNVFFLEEPVTPDDIDGLAEARAAVDIPIASGETMGSTYEFKELIDRRAVDIVQPDPSRVGLTQWKQIAKMAEQANMLCIPHDWSTGINIVAQIHLVASIPNGEYIEYHRPEPGQETEAAIMDELLMEPFELKNGYFEVPNKPGLGITLNEKTLKRYGVR
ncbi:MAG: mandelate racemase/muconate lactonizing enzyme family protein [Candidatus Bathyarchaeia archaeon]